MLVGFKDSGKLVMFVISVVKTSSILMFLLLGLTSYAQKVTDWDVLEVNKLQEITDTAARITFDGPVFTKAQEGLEGSKLCIEGYLTKIDSEDILSGTLYMLQRYQQTDYGEDYPLDAIIEVNFKKEPNQVNSTVKVKVKGVLRLNTDDFMHPFYILESAKVK